MIAAAKYKRLAVAMMRCNQLCNELKIPELISLDDQRRVLKAQDDDDAKEIFDLLGPKPLTEQIQ